MVEADAPGDNDQPAAHVLDLVEVDVHESHERLLHDVLGLADAADHPEGEVDEVAAVVRPDVGQSIVRHAVHQSEDDAGMPNVTSDRECHNR